MRSRASASLLEEIQWFQSFGWNEQRIADRLKLRRGTVVAALAETRHGRRSAEPFNQYETAS